MTDHRGKHVIEVELSTGEETFLVAMKNQVSGKAEDYVASITDSLQCIDKVARGEGTLISKIKNTMTDRHTVNTKVDETLEEVTGSTVNKFRCGMHPLDSFQKSSNKIVGETDVLSPKKYAHMPFSHRESTTQALITELWTSFSTTWEFGIGNNLMTFLKSQGFGGVKNHLEKETMFLRWISLMYYIVYG